MRVVLAFLQVLTKNLEWTTSDGRTFQILGSYGDRISAYWERFSLPGKSPSRRLLTWNEAQAAFDAATEKFLLYAIRKDEFGAEWLTREQLLDRVEKMFPGSTKKALRRGPKMEYVTKCGGTIVVPPKTQEHLRAHPEVSGVLAEAIGLITLPRNGEFLAVAVEMGRVVGRSGCVPTEPIRPSSPAMFALRVGRDKPSRVMVGVEGPESTTVVVLAFVAKETRTYVLITSFIGELAPKEPWDRSMRLGSAEAMDSLEFWTRNALVHDPSVMGPVFESSWSDVLGN